MHQPARVRRLHHRRIQPFGQAPATHRPRRASPPPAMITTRLAASSFRAASASIGRGRGVGRAGAAAAPGRSPHSIGITSVGTSNMHRAGPPGGHCGKGPVQARLPHRRARDLFGLAQRGAPSPPDPAIHADGPSPCPDVSRRFTPEITSIGTESAAACPIAVSALVSPGPVITKATPGLPVTRA